MKLSFPVTLLGIEDEGDRFRLKLQLDNSTALYLLFAKSRLMGGERITAEPGQMLELQLVLPTNQREIEFAAASKQRES